MAKLLPVADVAVKSDGTPLVAGLFAVSHREFSDRIILDRRPQNFQEKRVGKSALPMGCQLTRIVLAPHEGIRGSG
eukprot:1001817-Karenia_brevis.AAC.1